MNPLVMLTLLAAAWTAFAWSANRRFQLLGVGRPTCRLDRLGERIAALAKYGLAQWKMGYYPLAGNAHKLIFAGFAVLLVRSLILWGRGFDPTFCLFVFGREPIDLPIVGSLPLGAIYDFLKDVFAILVLAGVAVFVYFRVIVREKRMTLHPEGLVILGIIACMMIADMLYDGASIALEHGYRAYGCAAAGAPEICGGVDTVLAHLGSLPKQTGPALFEAWPSPAGSAAALLLSGLGPRALVVLAHAGFWTHSALVLIFLNILPYSKHFHILTALPNVFLADRTPKGRLVPLAESSEKLMEIVGAASEQSDTLEAPIGVARIEHFTWKALLDLYTCTECGRCSDNCPAFRTGKLLSPKMLTLDLRDHLYARERELLYRPGGPRGTTNGEPLQTHEAGHAHEGAADDHGPVYPDNPVADPPVASKPVDLVPGVIHPDVLWACTTCRACEEQCPVMISYVDKITEMRRSLVTIRGEMPAELMKPFAGMETNGNPWNLARIDRAAWADGLDVSTMVDRPQAKVLFWVGCAASYDDRAKKIARAIARLLQAAGVDFAILGQEETCTGDSARRAGNEFLFTTLAEQNVATLNGYKEKGGIETIVTACPHCFNTLKNEYPDFGGLYDVVHHTELLAKLVREGRLVPKHEVKSNVVFHDACYLGRYNDVYDPPRDILKSVPGVTLVEPDMRRATGLCCGAGGAQMWMEEQNKDRMNVARTRQLVETRADVIASGCPYCQTMLVDGLKAESLEDKVRQLDVAELLAESCGLGGSPS
jgi:Fe-S oxidoreductase